MATKSALIVVHSYYLRDTRPRRLGKALVGAGWDVDVVCARDSGESPTQRADGLKIHRLPARRKRGSKWRYIFEYTSFTVMALAAVTRLWNTKHHDAVYVIGIPNFLVFAALVPKMRGARVLLDMRDPLPEFFRAKYGFAESHPLIRMMLLEEKLSARFANQVVTVHHSMATLYERSLPPERIGIVMNVPDPALFTSAAATRDPDDRTMLYAGTVASRYGVDLALRAVARLRDEIPKLALRIVGDGDLIPELRAAARREELGDRIVFDGPVPLDEIPRIVGESWLGVQPNRDDPLMRFSLSTKLLEWCRLGLPVVAGETLPLVELFRNDEILFHAPDDLDGLCARILEAHTDPDALARRRERARATVEALSFDAEIDAFLRLIEG